MGNVEQVIGVFRERHQAEQALAAARRKGWAVPDPEHLVEDADGVHLPIGSASGPENVQQLLLEYGAYRTALS